MLKEFDMKARRQPRNQRAGNHTQAKSIRKIVEQRDGRKCAICWSKTSRLILHHSFELAKGKSPYADPHNPDYQLFLCSSCHNKIHNLFDRNSPLMIAYRKVCREIGDL